MDVLRIYGEFRWQLKANGRYRIAGRPDEPDEMNFVRKHAKEQAKEMEIWSERVFSAGSYSANVGIAIENGGWESEDQLRTSS
ncbi:hypothetical protein TrST_g9410 [Triparma strigata]|uniref:CobN/magnesium chelatase domain-containing protein n=1 Tax=Triparma strigata TaxID=1606541 RepID=A0A9W7B8A0_9STRA|nr:hypothetical protein TrST_g9410 [Triparma strigata]